MDAERARQIALAALSRYWSDAAAVEALPLARIGWPAEEPLPPRLERVALPGWAADMGAAGDLLVPAHRVAPGAGEAWRRTDWLGAATWHLHGCAERAHEARHGPIHSYSYRLKGWDAALWQHAWANRIALFLRRWAARHADVDEVALMGPLPEAEILLTHDIDAIEMTPALRFKQGAFHCFNAARSLLRGRPGTAARRLGAAWRFARAGGSLWHLDEVVERERAAGIAGHFFAYGGGGERSLRQSLFDPHYELSAASPLAQALGALRGEGFGVGLHQSFESWRDAEAMTDEKHRLERGAGLRVDSCRQHWLRFSWRETWDAQARAGFVMDATLGFNDRPGFRNGAALRFRPWSEARGEPLGIESVPTVLMDSHLFDYAEYDPRARDEELARWLGEVRAVHGVASVISHPHTLGPEYGWRPLFDALVTAVAEARR